MNRLRFKHGFQSWANLTNRMERLPWVKKMQHQYPGCYSFLLSRFNTHRFSGLPLTLFICGIILNITILSGIAEEIREASRLRDLDRSMAIWFSEHRMEKVARLVFRFTRLGSSPAVLGIFGVLSILLLRKNRFHAWISIASSLVLSTLTAYAGKVYYQIPRPGDLAWYEEFSYSFPSGHATIAVAYYGLLFYLLSNYVKGVNVKRMMLMLALVFITAMGFSRVYLGVHYLSDVLSGFAIGGIWLIFSIALLGWLDFRKEMRQKSQ